MLKTKLIILIALGLLLTHAPLILSAQAESPSLADTFKKIQSLNRKIDKAESPLKKEEQKALAQTEKHYAKLMEEIPPKDKFESQTEYEERLAGEKFILDTQKDDELESIRDKYSRLIKDKTATWSQERASLTTQEFTSPCKIELQEYNTDQRFFPAKVALNIPGTKRISEQAILKVSGPEARKLWPARDSLIAEAKIIFDKQGVMHTEFALYNDTGERFVLSDLVQADASKKPDKPVLPKGLMAYWKFDETSGTVAKDSSGNDCHGTVRGSAKWVKGKINGALKFDGKDDYVGAPALQERSLMLWLKPAQREQTTFYDGGTTYKGHQSYEVAIFKPNGLKGGCKFTTTYGLYFAFWGDDVAIPYGKIKSGWHHIAVSWDGDVTVRIGLDGKFPEGYIWDGSWSAKQTQPFTLHKQPHPDATATTQLGKGRYRMWNIGSAYFKGIIDEVKIYDRALTETEIKADYKRK